MHIYQRSDGKYILVAGPLETDEYAFDTYEEANMSARKVQFTQKLQEISTQLAGVADVVADIHKLYFDRGYNAGGAEPIIDEDIQTTGLKAADVVSIIVLLEQFNNFVSSQPVATGDYKSTLNKVRTDI